MLIVRGSQPTRVPHWPRQKGGWTNVLVRTRSELKRTKRRLIILRPKPSQGVPAPGSTLLLLQGHFPGTRTTVCRGTFHAILSRHHERAFCFLIFSVY